MRLTQTDSEQALSTMAETPTSTSEAQALEVANRSLGSLGRWPSSASYSPNWIIPFQELVRGTAAHAPRGSLSSAAAIFHGWSLRQRIVVVKQETLLNGNYLVQTFKKLIGEGAIGRVHLGRWQETDVAIKVDCGNIVLLGLAPLHICITTYVTAGGPQCPQQYSGRHANLDTGEPGMRVHGLRLCRC